MRLNGHMVVKDLDIFERVGHSTAHDEIVSFSIRRGKLSVQGEVSTFNGKLTVEFVKVRPLRLLSEAPFFQALQLLFPLRSVGCAEKVDPELKIQFCILFLMRQLIPVRTNQISISNVLPVTATQPLSWQHKRQQQDET